MDSRASLASQESTTQINMISPRKRPLHTCAASFSLVAHRAFTIAQGLNGPLGFIIKIAARLITLAGPLAYALKYQWVTMTILSFIDGRILALEGMIERFYPPSHIVFDKIDDLVQVTESLPGKFDNAVSKIPAHFHHISFFDWTLVRAIWLLNFVVATLTNYWRKPKGTREKEIKVDASSNIDRNCEPEPGSVHEADRSTPNYNKINKGNNFSSPRKAVTYKDVLLQKGTNKGGIGTKEENKVSNREEVESSVADDDESETNSRDDLIELFESSWLMTSPGKNDENYAPRSVSFAF